MRPSARWAAGVHTHPRFESSLVSLVREIQRSKRVIELLDTDPVVAGFRNPYLSEYLAQAAGENWNMYSDNSDWENRLKNAIANFEKRERQLDIAAEDIVLSPGCAGAFSVLHHAMLDPGDEVVAADPSHYLTGPTSYWSCFGAKPVPYATREQNEWQPDLEDLRAKITHKTKALFINSPNNPTGAIYDENILRRIVDIAGEYNLLIISDEIYGLLVYDGIRAPPITTVSRDVPTIMVSGFSKFFMGPGWRIGYMMFSDPTGKMMTLTETIRKLANVYGFSTDGMATPILAAATRVYENEQACHLGKDMAKELQIRRDFSWKRLNEMDHISCVRPRGGFSIFPHLMVTGKTWKRMEDFLLHLVREEQVAFDDGSWYGESGSGHFRAVFLQDLETLNEAFGRLERFLARNA